MLDQLRDDMVKASLSKSFPNRGIGRHCNNSPKNFWLQNYWHMRLTILEPSHWHILKTGTWKRTPKMLESEIRHKDNQHAGQSSRPQSLNQHEERSEFFASALPACPKLVHTCYKRKRSHAITRRAGASLTAGYQ